jgi:hypothetical protein
VIGNSIKQRLNEVEVLRTRNAELEEKLRQVEYTDLNVFATPSPNLLQAVPSARTTAIAPRQIEYCQSLSFIQKSATAGLTLGATHTSQGARGGNNSLSGGIQDCGYDDEYQNMDLGDLNCFGELLGISSDNTMVSSRFCNEPIQTEMRATRQPSSSNCAVGCEQTKTNASVYAAEHGMLDILSFLLDKGVSIGTQSGVYSTPLHQACERGDVDMVETILTKNGAQYINELDCAQLTPLHYAVKSGSLRVVELLVQQGAHVDRTFLRKERKACCSPSSLS